MAKKEKNTIHKVMLLFLLISYLLSGFTIYEIFLFQGIETFIRYVIIERLLREKQRKNLIKSYLYFG